MTDYQILYEYQIGGMAVKDCPTMSFLGWVASKLNGVAQYGQGMAELRGYVTAPPIGKMADMKKVEIFRLLEKAGAKL